MERVGIVDKVDCEKKLRKIIKLCVFEMKGVELMFKVFRKIVFKFEILVFGL